MFEKNSNNDSINRNNNNRGEVQHDAQVPPSLSLHQQQQQPHQFLLRSTTDEVNNVGNITNNVTAVQQQVDSLTDQLADFKSFGASLTTTLASEPLTASAGSGCNR